MKKITLNPGEIVTLEIQDETIFLECDESDVKIIGNNNKIYYAGCFSRLEIKGSNNTIRPMESSL